MQIWFIARDAIGSRYGSGLKPSLRVTRILISTVCSCENVNEQKCTS